MLLGLLFLGSADARQLATTKPGASTNNGKGTAAATNPGSSRLWMTVGERRFAVTLHDNATGRAFADLLPLTLEMEELNGNEKKAELPKPLPGAASRPGTIHNGDLLLYRSDTLVVFYKTFSSPYSYASVGRVDDPAGLAQALGQHNVRLAFSK